MTQLGAVAPAAMPMLYALLEENRGPLRFIAGGTDMLVRPLPESGVLVDVSAVDGMAFIEARGEDVRIGAATTVASICGHQALAARLAALGQAAGQFGSAQIRNRATIGGNIANGAPAADLVPVLLAADARLVLLKPGGLRREVPLAADACMPGDLITEIILPSAGNSSTSAFVKLGPRSDLAISRICLALVAGFENGRFGAVRLAAGALGPFARRLPTAEAALSGRSLDASTLRDFIAALAAEVDMAIPGRLSQPYKRRAIAGIGLDLIGRFAATNPRGRLFEEALQ